MLVGSELPVLQLLMVSSWSSWAAAELEQDCTDQQLVRLQEKLQKCTFQLLVEFEEGRSSLTNPTVSFVCVTNYRTKFDCCIIALDHTVFSCSKEYHSSYQ
jgi:hypothetical protein